MSANAGRRGNGRTDGGRRESGAGGLEMRLMRDPFGGAPRCARDRSYPADPRPTAASAPTPAPARSADERDLRGHLDPNVRL